MATNVTIILQGVGMIYQKNDLWKIIYPFDDCHTLKFSFHEDGKLDEAIIGSLAAGNNTTIEIVTNLPSPGATEGENFTKFFDLTEADAHSSGIQRIANNGVLLTIANATLDIYEMTQSNYVLKENGTIIKELGLIGYSAKAEIELGPGETFSILVNGSKILEGESNLSYILNFNNHCYRPPNAFAEDTTDFLMLYDVLEDASIGGRRFEVARHPDDLPPASSASGSSTLFFDTNPAPLAKGLPCHKVRASRTNDLP